MSVIVKGMEMPENCGKCRFVGACGVHGIEEWPDIESIMFNDIIGIDGSRDEACPLHPLPEKHGRLIDADELEDVFYRFHSQSVGYVQDMETIVEAEGDD